MEINKNNSKDNPLNIKSISKEDLEDFCQKLRSAKFKLWIKNICNNKKCKTEFIKLIQYKDLYYHTILDEKYLYCDKCHRKMTNLKNYGTEYPQQNEIIKEKIYSTNIKKYGSKVYWCSNDFKEKSKKTCMEKYGTEYSFQSENNKEKSKETMNEKYGVDYAQQNEEIREKTKETWKNNLGVDNPAKSEEVLNKRKSTNNDRYGTNWFVQSEKFRQTLLELYGSENPSSGNNYIYNSISFDSSWELAFYIYHLDKKHKIIRNETIYFLYKTKDGKLHRYYPDFILNKKYIEIKGDHFLRFYKNGNIRTLVNFEQTKELKEKFKCMKDNNIIILYSKTLTKYFKYIIKNYGSLDYLKQFKIVH